MKNVMSGKLGGFTLIELLVVVLIIGILAAVALPQYKVAVLKSRYVQAQVLAKGFAEAAQRYVLANGEPPNAWDEMDLTVSANCSGATATDRGFLSCPTIKVACDLMGGSSQNIICYIQGNFLAYAHWFDGSGKRQCFAKETDNVANAVCKSMGGIKEKTENIYYFNSSGNFYNLP